MTDLAKAVDCYSDWRWRLSNLYRVQNKEGENIQFKPNWMQERLFNELHFCNVILKARQMGSSTFIQLIMLDACLFNSNISAGTIAHNKEDAIEIFKTKAKFPYDNLPEALRISRHATQDSARMLRFSNGSSLRVGTSLRSGTLQYLHISEFGKICALYPEKAREIRTGSLNTVQSGQFVFIESTAEGQEGDFYEMCQTAQSKKRDKTKLTELDYKFHFFPWWEEPAYQLEDYQSVVISKEMKQYFQDLIRVSIHLTGPQKAWYVKKLETQREDMKREFPATPEEAFEASVEGVIYAEQIKTMEEDRRITSVPYDAQYPVEVGWDLGMRDYMALIAFQRVGLEVRCIRSIHGSDKPIPHWLGILGDWKQQYGYRYGTMWLPHDAKKPSMEREDAAPAEKVMRLANHETYVVRRCHDLWQDINLTRDFFPYLWFDEENCADLVHAIRHYRKEWDDKRGTWRERPLHDENSHLADALRCIATAPRDKHRKKRRDIDYDQYLRVT